MSFVKRAEYEQFWQSLAKSRRPLAQKGIEPIRYRLEKALESNPSIIVEKVHFTSHEDAILEVVCTWVGLDPNGRAAENAVKTAWNAEILEAEAEKMTFDPQDDLFYFQFAGQMPEKRYLTGKVLIRL